MAVRRLDSPVGPLVLSATDPGLTQLFFERADHSSRLECGTDSERAEEHLDTAESQLSAWFAGKLRAFDLTLAATGTEFQQAVWKTLLTIPFGSTMTYGEIARQLSRPDASRAVGAAVGRNPISIIVPCHRVIGSTRQLTGFAGGLTAKQQLLELEGHDFAQASSRLALVSTSK